MSYIDDLALDIRSRVAPDVEVPAASESLFRSYAVLCLATATETTLADVHNAWVAWMSGESPAHPSLLPFDQLDTSTQNQDAPFLDAIKSAAAARG